VAAGRSFSNLLTVDRALFQKEALARLEHRLKAQGSSGLGIQLDGLAIHDLHPPEQVVDAYHEVARALETRDAQINRALAAKDSKVRAADSERADTVRKAEAQMRASVHAAETDRTLFEGMYQLKRAFPVLLDKTLRWELTVLYLGKREKLILDVDVNGLRIVVQDPEHPAGYAPITVPFERLPFQPPAKPADAETGS